MPSPTRRISGPSRRGSRRAISPCRGRWRRAPPAAPSAGGCPRRLGEASIRTSPATSGSFLGPWLRACWCKLGLEERVAGVGEVTVRRGVCLVRKTSSAAGARGKGDEDIEEDCLGQGVVSGMLDSVGLEPLEPKASRRGTDAGDQGTPRETRRRASPGRVHRGRAASPIWKSCHLSTSPDSLLRPS